MGRVRELAGAQPGVWLWIGQFIGGWAMKGGLMPAMSRPCRRWWDPVDGRGARSSVTGLVAIVVLYAVTLTVFATVRELQFWDYTPDGVQSP